VRELGIRIRLAGTLFADVCGVVEPALSVSSPPYGALVRTVDAGRVRVFCGSCCVAAIAGVLAVANPIFAHRSRRARASARSSASRYAVCRWERRGRGGGSVAAAAIGDRRRSVESVDRLGLMG